MNTYYRMVIELMKESLTSVNRVNSDESLRVLTEIEKAITTAKSPASPLMSFTSSKPMLNLLER